MLRQFPGLRPFIITIPTRIHTMGNTAIFRRIPQRCNSNSSSSIFNTPMGQCRSTQPRLSSNSNINNHCTRNKPCKKSTQDTPTATSQPRAMQWAC
ncbi:hypothetical protein EMPG_13415 [Blastomyces silverae]|uniref:Uncharacterized protein n=1 Tax=Blastomyces silverae TaxID=2060906 RepID=A0A0H1BJ29_9EURO|nr:hypothetical protein EMPG_13415 [Blastomyces silverae]